VETLAGVLEVVLTALPDGRTEVALEMPTPRFGEPVPASEVATALDLPTEILKIDGHGPQRVSCGFDHIVVPVGDRDAMRGRFRDFARIQELTDVYGVAGLALMCPETGHDDVDFTCRFFHPGDRWCEDVTSGNGLGAVAAYAVRNRLVPPAERMQIVTEQGITLGRPTRAVLNLRLLGEELRSVSIAATGAVVMRGSFQFDRLVRGAVV